MSRRLSIQFGAVLLLACGLAGAEASAACQNPGDVCKHIKYCAVDNLTDKNRVDRDRLNDAIERGVKHEIYAATEACQRNVGNIRDWEDDSRGCGDEDFFQIARRARDAGWNCARDVRFYCYTQGQYHEIDDLQCRGPRNHGAACLCNIHGQSSPGTVYAR